jgi:hypothetical protein
MIDQNGRRVIDFESALRNASRIGTYVDTVVDMFESRAWRHYATASGTEGWRAREFDYFLIACGAGYADVAQLLAWKKAKAVNVAAAMEGDDRRTRRSLEDASRDWRSPTGTSLIDLARRNGWLRSQTAAPTLKVAPVSSYARAVVRGGIPLGTRGRRYRTRTLLEELPAARRRELEAEGLRLRQHYTEAELRYLREQLVPARRGRPRQSQVSKATERVRRHRALQKNLIVTPVAARTAAR